MGREENIAVFKDTEKLCRLDLFTEPATVVVSKKRSFEAANCCESIIFLV